MSRSHGTELQMFRGRDKLRSRTQKRIEGKTCIVGLSYTEKAIEVKKLEEFIDRENVGVSFLKKMDKGRYDFRRHERQVPWMPLEDNF